MTCALLTSKALISFITSPLPKQRVLIRSFVIYDIFAGKTLLLGIGEHCFTKKELKTLAFFFKYCNKFIINKQLRFDGNFFTIVKGFQYRPNRIYYLAKYHLILH